MDSKIAEFIKLGNEPVAVVRSSEKPEGAAMFEEGERGCVISLLGNASEGRTAALSDATVACPGGKVGSGFGPFDGDMIDYFLSVGGRGPRPGEFYKETPEFAHEFTANVPQIEHEEYLVLAPLSKIEDGARVDSVVFLVNADQLSALVTLANYDKPTQDNVRIDSAAGCMQSLLLSIDDADNGRKLCRVGLTDPSARKCIGKDLLSFSIPYERFREMESKAEGSFLTKETWAEISERI